MSVKFLLVLFWHFSDFSSKSSPGQGWGQGCPVDLVNQLDLAWEILPALHLHLFVEGRSGRLAEKYIHPAIILSQRSGDSDRRQFHFIIFGTPPPHLSPLTLPPPCHSSLGIFWDKVFSSWRATNGLISLAQNIRMKFTRDWRIRIFSFNLVKDFLNTNMEIFYVPDGDCYRC